MERSIRIGKDFNVRWSINKRVDGERQPYELAGKELVLQYRTPYGLKEATEWKTEGNTIVWTFRGREQKSLGSYELILTENGGKDGMVTVDTCRAFKLVAHSCEETEGSGSDIVIEDVVLESEVAFAALRGPQGERGPEGPQGPQGERGPQGEQGPAGPSYDDTEIKGKLAELSEANEVLKEAQQFTDVAIKDLQDMKIDRENDDYYPKMAVGLADNLAGVDVVDSEINFRRSGGGAITDGVARIETIKGNSVVWNQCFKRGASDAGTWDGNMLTINKAYSSALTTYDISTYAAEYVGAIANHKYYIGIEIVSGTIVGDLTYVVYPAGVYTRVVLNNSNKAYQVIISQLNNNQYWFVRTYSAGSEFTNVKVRHVIYDLTQMFGAGNEPTTIEEFYQRAPLGVDLNAYNEGEAIHMNVQSIESVGVNQWNGALEHGRISDGENSGASTDMLRSVGFVDVLPLTTYYVTQPYMFYPYYYDENKKWISVQPTPSYTFSTPNNARYLRFFLYNLNGEAPLDTLVSINISDPSINGKYYPYIKRVEDLAVIHKYFPDGMKSAGSAHDEIRYNKATQKWEYSKGRFRSVDLGTCDWEQDASDASRFRTFAIPWKATYTNNLLCEKYATAPTQDISMPDKSIAMTNSQAAPLFRVKDSAYTDAATFKAAMAGVILYYESNDWEWVELDAEDQFKDLDYQVWNCGTEKAIAEGISAPLAADITYGFNAIGKIKELESLVAALRAKVGI